MTEPRRYTDRLSYRAIIGAVTVLVPVVVNIVTLAYLWGRMTERVDGLEKQVGTLQALVVSHITTTTGLFRVVPQSDRETTPQPPEKAPAIRPQHFSTDGCHIPLLKTGKTREANKWPASRPPT